MMTLEELDGFKKGRMFEQFVRDELFSRRKYDIIHQTHSFNTLKDRRVEDSMNPDFTFRRKSDGYVFSVECKYRKKWYAGSLQWAKEEQIENYKAFSKINGYKVFIILGVGGKPNNPNEIFIIQLDKLNDIRLDRDSIRKFGIVIRQDTDDLSCCIDEIRRREKIEEMIQDLMKKCEDLYTLVYFLQDTL